MSRDDGYTRYTVRIPTPLYERVKAAAGEASVNSLVVEILDEKYPEPDPQTDYEFRMRRSGEILAEMGEIIAGYKDPKQDPTELARRFEVLKEEHAWLFPAPSNPA